MLNIKIKKLRKALNLSQVDLAKKLSVTKQTISNWENDNIQPSIDMLEKLADFFKVTTDYMLGRDSVNRISVDGLSDEQIAHISQLVDDLICANKNPN